MLFEPDIDLQSMRLDKGRFFSQQCGTTLEVMIADLTDSDLADENIKATSLILAGRIFERDPSIQLVLASYLLPDKPEIENWGLLRVRRCVVPRSIMNLSKTDRINELTICLDALRIERLIADSGLLSSEFTCVVESMLNYRTMVFAPDSVLKALSDKDATDIAIQIAVMILREVTSVPEIRVSFSKDMNDGARILYFNREHLQLYDAGDYTKLSTEVKLSAGRLVLI